MLYPKRFFLYNVTRIGDKNGNVRFQVVFTGSNNIIQKKYNDFWKWQLFTDFETELLKDLTGFSSCPDFHFDL